MTNLKELLYDWTHWDFASFFLGTLLGVIPREDSFTKSKHIFWTNNATGVMLHNLLDDLVKAGILETQDEGEKYRWRR